MFRRRRRHTMRLFLPLATLALFAGGGWMLWPRFASGTGSPDSGPPAAAAQTPIPTAVLASSNNPSRDGYAPVWQSSEAEKLPKSAGPLGQDVAAKASPPDEVLIPGTGAAPPKSSFDVSKPPADALGQDAEPAALAQADSSKTAPVTPGVNPADDPPARSAGGRQALQAALERYKQGKRVEARHELNAMLATTRDASEAAALRRHLARIADETVFTRQTEANDPLFDAYVVQDGDKLINIAKPFDVPYEAFLMINGIPDATKVRAKEKLKAPRGPFNIRISKSDFRLDLYLQDLYLRSFPVGLGAERGTPEGVWTVKERLPNPTYFPPASAKNKAIIAGNDPQNPLGEYWIGLLGIEGDAVGQQGFGIHGTIEPESIGKNASAGCVRMLNDDVQFVYSLVQPGKTTVTIVP